MNKLLIRICSLALAVLLVLPLVSSVMVGAQDITKQDIQEKMLEILYNNDEAGFVSCDFDGYVELRPKRHEGIDFAIGQGHDVCALIDGVVTNAGGDSLNTIAIYDEENDKTVIYLHTSSSVNIEVGDTVKVGQVIALEGSKGAKGAVHTHVEVRDGKQTKASYSSDYVLDNENPYEYWEKVLFEKKNETKAHARLPIPARKTNK
ncbi:MAG: M23 family metallopeptidase [Ruminococcaceae bacterium]|nr:M23 family metallopeptidase [Oscillospiraceae bacterium]